MARKIRRVVVEVVRDDLLAAIPAPEIEERRRPCQVRKRGADAVADPARRYRRLLEMLRRRLEAVRLLERVSQVALDGADAAQPDSTSQLQCALVEDQALLTPAASSEDP